MRAVSVARYQPIAGRSVCRPPLPTAPTALPLFRIIFVTSEPNGSGTTSPGVTGQSSIGALAAARSTSSTPGERKEVTNECRGIKEGLRPGFSTATASASFLTRDFARQKVSKFSYTQRACLHSCSKLHLYSTMVSQTVNKTNLHPGGLA